MNFGSYDNLSSLMTAIKTRFVKKTDMPVLTQAEYNALVEAGTVDPNKDYHISDGVLSGAPLDDLVISPSKLWSSQKTSNEIENKQDIIQYSVMPTANVNNLGKIIQYIGTTTTSAPIYTNGYFYKCVENSGIYSWEAQPVQSSSGGASIDDTTTALDKTWSSNKIDGLIDHIVDTATQNSAHNWLPYPYDGYSMPYTSLGLTFTENEDRTITLSAPEYPYTVSQAFSFPLYDTNNLGKKLKSKPGNFIFSGSPIVSDDLYLYFEYRDPNGYHYYYDKGNGCPVEISNQIYTGGGNTYLRIYVNKDFVLTEPLTFKPMFRLSTDIDSTFTPPGLLSYKEISNSVDLLNTATTISNKYVQNYIQVFNNDQISGQITAIGNIWVMHINLYIQLPTKSSGSSAYTGWWGRTNVDFSPINNPLIVPVYDENYTQLGLMYINHSGGEYGKNFSYTTSVTSDMTSSGFGSAQFDFIWIVNDEQTIS